MVKVVYNTTPDRVFRLSIIGIKGYLKRKGYKEVKITTSGDSYTISVNDLHIDCHNISREDPDLVSVVEELGIYAGDQCNLAIVDLPKGTLYRIICSGNQGTGPEVIEHPESIKWNIAGTR